MIDIPKAALLMTRATKLIPLKLLESENVHIAEQCQRLDPQWI